MPLDPYVAAFRGRGSGRAIRSIVPSVRTIGDNVNTYRRLALIGGVLWLITFATSIPAFFFFYAPVLDDVNYIVGSGEDARIATGALLEMLLILANVGTALAFLPILRRQNYALAHGFLAARIMECVFIAVGIVSMLAILTLRSDSAEGSASLITAGESLVAIHDATFLLGPGFMVGVGNGLILGYLMYRSGLVPRGLAILALVAGPLLIVSGVLVMYDVIEAGSPVQGLMSVPEALWELSLGLYLVFKGFKPAPVLSDASPPDRDRTAYQAA